MMICRIEGSVHATIKDPTLEGRVLLLAQPLDLEGQPDGDILIAVDRVGAGEGEMVLVSKEGGGARIALGDDNVPVQALVIAKIDDVFLRS